jgi:hypothetical protein
MSTRLGFTTILILVAIACGRDRTVVPVTPAAPTPTPTPSPGGPTPLTGSNTLTGVVVETSSQGPLAGVSVNAWVQESRLGYSYVWAHGPVISDATGMFRLPSLAIGTTVRLQVWKDGYVQQCAAPLVAITSDLRQDVQLVPRTNVPVSPESIAPPAPGFRSVSGTIVENTAAGPQPVAGVFVDFEPVEDFPAAITYGDTAGRYLLCGLPDTETVTLGAGLGNRVAYLNVAPGRTTGVNIVLP